MHNSAVRGDRHSNRNIRKKVTINQPQLAAAQCSGRSSAISNQNSNIEILRSSNHLAALIGTATAVLTAWEIARASAKSKGKNNQPVSGNNSGCGSGCSKHITWVLTADSMMMKNPQGLILSCMRHAMTSPFHCSKKGNGCGSSSNCHRPRVQRRLPQIP